MKFRKLPIWALALSILAGSGCVSDDYNYAKEGAYGTVSFALEADSNITSGEITRADGESSNATIEIAEALGAGESFDATKLTDNFTVKVLDSSKKKTLKECLLKDYKPEDLSLELGTYYVQASYDPQKIGFYVVGQDGKPTEASGLPAFEGEAMFTISSEDAESETPKQVPIEVALKNSILRIKCTDIFTKYFSEYSAVVTQSTEDDAPSVSYDQAKIALESDVDAVAEGAFLEPVKTYIAYTFKPNPDQAQGTNATDKTGIVGGADAGVKLNAKSCHTVIFDISTIGGVDKLTITFDDTVTTVDIGDIEINE